MTPAFNPYHNARIVPGNYARTLMASQVLAVADVIHAVRNHDDTWPGKRPGQQWCRGQTPNGTTLKVLMDPVIAGEARIVLVFIT